MPDPPSSPDAGGDLPPKRPARTVLASSSGRLAPGYGSAPARPDVEERLPAAAPAPLEAPSRRGRRRRRSTRDRVLRWVLAFVALVLLVALSGYAYVRYRWSQVATAACDTCTAVAGGQPFNVLLVGSDTRVGQGAAFGSVSGQRSDTIKILHVDPASGTAQLLSIPRDTYVEMSDIPSSSGLSGAQKINTAFNEGPSSLIATIQNSFGIPISHFVEINFEGLTNAVNTVGGINLDFPYPVRDNDNGVNNSGLVITHPGCQRLDGAMTLALARSRYYEYYAHGSWHYDPSSDLGRIKRQNIVIEAIVARARGSYNPLTLNAFLGAIVHDVTVDKQMTFGDMFSLATRYHAFSPSSLASFTLPTTSGVSSRAGDVQVVQQPATEQMLMQFLGAPPNPVSTPPLTAGGSPIYPPPPTTTTTAPHGPAPAPSPSSQAASFDPTTC